MYYNNRNTSELIININFNCYMQIIVKILVIDFLLYFIYLEGIIRLNKKI